jgi:hypothetical protein
MKYKTALGKQYELHVNACNDPIIAHSLTGNPQNTLQTYTTLFSCEQITLSGHEFRLLTMRFREVKI